MTHEKIKTITVGCEVPSLSSKPSLQGVLASDKPFNLGCITHAAPTLHCNSDDIAAKATWDCCFFPLTFQFSV